MDELIRVAKSNLGVHEQAARDAAGGLLVVIRDHASQKDFHQILRDVPGSADLLADTLRSEAGGGYLPDLMGKTLAAVDCPPEDASGLELVCRLLGAGLSTAQLGPFLGAFFGCMKGKTGAEVVQRVMDRIPQINQLID